jgi:DNA-binding response OmpR family regulator
MEHLQSENEETAPRIRVLVTDDEDTFRKALVYFLKSTHQYDVDAADSGDSAIEALEQQSYDVIILDYRMPGRTGLNVLQWMHEQKMETPVIMLTGAGSENIAVEAMKLGAYDYIRKDLFDRNHLPIIINSVYERYLFKKERALNDDLRRMNNNSSATAELMRNYITTNSQLLNTTLSVISLVIDEMEKELTLNLPKETKDYIEKACEVIKESYQIVSFGTKSLLDLTRVIYARLEGSTDIQRDIEELAAKLKTLEEKMTA